MKESYGEGIANRTGSVWAVKTPEQFTYDADGNMLSDALRQYEWDAENRLIAVTVSNLVGTAGPAVRLEFAYDYMGRRVSKTVYEWISGSWSLKQSSRFLYDGWNLVREITTATGLGSITDDYVWGLDLSGTLQGAGGIGGLLARYRSVHRYYDEQGMLIICHRPPGNPENKNTMRINENAWPAHQRHGDTLGACAGGQVSSFLYTFDGNGNVSELLQPTSNGLQSISGHYEYSPFGETIVATGPEAFDNPFRFSTKYWDDESGLYYYGYRYYSPSLGRWLSRDPIGERGGLSLYTFVGNGAINSVDPLGLADGNPVPPVVYFIAYWTVSGPTPGNCGEFSWAIRWLLSYVADYGGQVVQHIKWDIDASDCAGNKTMCDGQNWEGWEGLGFIPQGMSVTGSGHDDLWMAPSCGVCTKGTITLAGSASFYDGLTSLPPSFVNDGSEPWGNAPHTPADPGLTASRVVGPISRTLTATWNCCPNVQQTTLSVAP